MLFTTPSAHGPPSTRHRARLFRYFGSVDMIASRKLIFPPRTFVVRFTFSTTAPPDPNSATFRKYRVAGLPCRSVYSARPASIILRRLPWSRVSTSRGSADWWIVFAKSVPVPTGAIASATSLLGRASRRIAFTTSLTVPSPPIASSVFAPALIASRASRVASKGADVYRIADARFASRRTRSSLRAYRRARPFPALGFAIPTMAGLSLTARLPPSPVRPEDSTEPFEFARPSLRVPSQFGSHRVDNRGRDFGALVRELVEQPRPADEDVIEMDCHFILRAPSRSR